MFLSIIICFAFGGLFLYLGILGNKKIKRFIEVAVRYNAEIVEVDFEEVETHNPGIGGPIKKNVYIAKVRFTDSEGNAIFSEVSFDENKRKGVGNTVEMLYEPTMYKEPKFENEIQLNTTGSKVSKVLGIAFFIMPVIVYITT